MTHAIRVLGAAGGLLTVTLLAACQAIEKVKYEFSGGETEIRWLSTLPQMKDPNKKSNLVYLSVQDITGEIGESTVRDAVSAELGGKGYKMEPDPHRADYQLKIVARNLYEGAPTERMGAADNETRKGVGYTLVADVRIAERVPEGIAVKSEAREGSVMQEDLFQGDQEGHSTSGNNVAWVRENKSYYAVYQLRAQVYNKGSGLFSGRGTSAKKMNERLAKSLPGLFPQVD